MVNPNTQDTQKVFQSATKNYKQFMGAVEPVSSTPYMTQIYDNMTKMFDAFTKGALLEQGANSEILLRTVYRSLSSDFLKVVQDTDAVDKIVEAIKAKQDSVSSGKTGSNMASDTTKQVATNTFDSSNCDIMQVVVDFIDELQNAILQVKLDLTREYEKKKLEYAKSRMGQQEDLDKLNKVSLEQDTETSETIETMTQEEQEWKEAQLEKLEKLLDTFKSVGDNRGKEGQYIKDIQKTLDTDKNLQQLAKPKKNFDIKKIVGDIKGVLTKEMEAVRKSAYEEGKKQGIEIGKQQAEQSDGGKGGPPKPKAKAPTKTKEYNVPKMGKQKGKSAPQKKGGGLTDMGGAVQQELAGKKSNIGNTKLKVSPDGSCVCPICGTKHMPGQPHAHQPQKGGKIAQKPKVLQKQPDNSGGGGDISTDKVTSAINTIHGNIQKMVGNPKFKNAFMLNYKLIQKGVQKQMGKIDKSEKSMSKDLSKTEREIKKLKKKKSGNLLTRLMNGGITGFLFTIIGGLILITLARIALKKWKEAYMPPTDGSTMTIFGFQIPGWDQMKAVGIGLWNFFTVGLANHWDRLKLFFYKIKESLFGKKGAFKNMIWVRHTLRRIIFAWIIGQTKKVGGKVLGLILKIIGWAFCWIPGVQPVCNFLAEFGPALYTFITTQLMLIWSKKKAEEETSAQQMAAGQNAQGQKMLKKINGQLKSLSKGIKPFKNQMANIPGLQTVNFHGVGKGMAQKPMAIMRSVPTKLNKNFKKSVAVQEEQWKQKEEGMDAAFDKRLKSKNKRDLLVSINTQLGQMNAQLNEFANQWRASGKPYGPEFEKAKEEKARQLLHEATAATLTPQIAALDKYIATLSKSKRFQGVKGYLYDPENGWNPGYRVVASDLRSIIPQTPFERLHKKADVYFGQPIGPDSDPRGYMPFTWMQHGARISVHPILYELARAKAIRTLYSFIQGGFLQDGGWRWKMYKDPADVLKSCNKDWLEWNYAVKEHGHMDYGKDGNSDIKPDDVLFKDYFTRFMIKYRNGKIDLSKNNLDFAKSQYNDHLGIDGDTWEAVSDAVAAPGKWIAKQASDTIDTIQRTLSYDKWEDKEEEIETEEKVPEETEVVEQEERQEKKWWNPFSWKWVKWLVDVIKKIVVWVVKKVKKVITKAMRAAQAAARLNMWRDVGINGMTYGTVRDFMIDKGVIHMFNRGIIQNTVGTAEPLIEFLTDKGILPKAPAEKDATPIHDLMGGFYSWAGINGYKWTQVDWAAKAGFAQSFLEYLSFIVLPQWNICEQLLSDDITYKTDETYKKMHEGITKLHELLTADAIFQFLKDHLRFPNMKIRIIDYANAANKRDIRKLDSYRWKMGIPTPSEKSDILQKLQPMWGKIGSMSDTELQENMDKVKKLMQGGQLEAKYTGDMAYSQQLRKYYAALSKEKEARLEAQASGDKIVKKPGEIKQKVIEEPPKTMEEIEAERKREEAEAARRAAEEEARKKAEEERKLKEEAKRKEELAIAQAKIKAMEKIKKEEENYEKILEKMISDPGKVTDEELKSLGDEVKNLKQEAENRIAQLPREEREVKLALIRGDKLSEKTFSEVKETTIGLHGNLQAYIEEVGKIPVGNILAIQNQAGGKQSTVKQIDTDAVDMGDE